MWTVPKHPEFGTHKEVARHAIFIPVVPRVNTPTFPIRMEEWIRNRLARKGTLRVNANQYWVMVF